MVKSKYRVPTILGIIALVLILVSIAFGGTDVLGNTFSTKQHLITCDVTLTNPIGIPLILNGDVHITNLICQNEGKCPLISTFSIISDSGNLQLLMSDGVKQTKSYNILESKSSTLQLKVCSDSVSGKVKVFDANNNIIDQRDVVAN